MNRSPDAIVGSTATDVGNGSVDVRIGGLRLLPQQRNDGENHTRLTIPALRNALGKPRLLNWMGAITRQPFYSGDRPAHGGTDWQHAGAYGLTVHQYRTGPAGTDATAEFRAGEVKPITQHPEQGSVGINFHSTRFAVYLKLEHDQAPCAE